MSTAPPSSAAAASRLISLLSRPRFSIPIALCFFFLFTTAFVHPSSPVSLRGAQPLYISPYQDYPPSLPDRLASSGWRNGTEGGGASWEGRRKANATFVMLARNSDLYILTPMQNMEDRFNWWAGYDWVFLNDEPFSDEFKKQTQAIASTKCEYGLIEPEIWNQPVWIDEERATKGREKLVSQNIIYGDSVPYRNMCRFNSGYFYRHPLLMKRKYYWRIEPSVRFFCDLKYDPFLKMQDEKKVYGFTLSLFEFTETIETLWNTTVEFMKLHPEHVAKDNSMDFLSDDKGGDYNHCHFWSNFEIGDLDFWRGKAYSDYFDFLDQKGGFYYERWGDAPVHSLGVGLFAPKDSIQFFSDIGYYHGPYTHCPVGEAHVANRCSCQESENFDHKWFSCTAKWEAIHPGKKWYGGEPRA